MAEDNNIYSYTTSFCLLDSHSKNIQLAKGYGFQISWKSISKKAEYEISTKDFNVDILKLGLTYTKLPFASAQENCCFAELKPDETCRMWILSSDLKVTLVVKWRYKEEKSIIPPLTLSEAFSSLYFADVKFITSDNQKIPSYRMLLSHFSDVFKKMFEASYAEDSKLPIIINLEDVNSDILFRVIDYCTEKYDRIAGFEIDLIKFANKYGIKGLKEECFKSLQNTLDLENICDRTIIAFQQGYKPFKQKCIEYLSNNKHEIGPEKLETLPKQALVRLCLYSS
uniref:BTB domain-containing protein n=1 Tax=Panagrolaimus davidi TaxID=227884 RepID=A0A914NZQ3_9BILA